MAKYTKEQILDRIEEIICEGCDNKGLCSLEQIITCAKASTNPDVWKILKGENR